MMMRGVEKQNSRTITSAMRGSFLDDPRTREEFLWPGPRHPMMEVDLPRHERRGTTVERNVSALMLQREELLLFDCGEGTQRQMMRYGVGFAVEDVFITHYHSDHILGIPGLLRTLGMQGRTAPLRIHGPRGAKRQLGTLVELGMERMKFPVELRELTAGDRLPRGTMSWSWARPVTGVTAWPTLWWSRSGRDGSTPSTPGHSASPRDRSGGRFIAVSR